MSRRRPQNIVVTGASRGIGAALAVRYAREGAALALIGRRSDTLETVAAECRASGAESVIAEAVDVRDHAALSGRIAEFDRRRPIDLMIANAGVTGGWSGPGVAETPEDSRRLMEINVTGALNAVHAVLPAMLERGDGQIALMSSIAAFVPLRGTPSYCASKAALLSYALSLRETVRRQGVRVSAICPGYVDTELLGRLSGGRPVLVPPARAAEIIASGLARDRRVIAFPALVAAATRLLGLLPPVLSRPVLPSLTVAPFEED